MNYSTGIIKSCLFFVVFFFAQSTLFGQVTLTINKSNNAPIPVQSGVPFTYTIGYSWSGGIPADSTLIIQDIVPSGLDVIYPYTNYPGQTTFNSLTNTVTYTRTGITTTAGSGVLLVYVNFKIGVTCNGTQICDTARIQEHAQQAKWYYSNPSCAFASAHNNWTFENELYAGCAATCPPGPTNEVIFRVKIINPAGPYGGLNLTKLSLFDSFPVASGAIITAVTTPGPGSLNVTTLPGNGTGWYQSGTGTNTITIKGDTSPPLVLSVWNYWITLYIHVSFPCNQIGNTIISSANLSFNTPCDTSKILHFTDTAQVTICQAVQKGNLYKDFFVTTYDPYNPYYFPGTITPGCCGTYRISYTNTGTVAQTAVTLTDTIPGSMDVSQFYTDIPAGMGPVKEEVWTYPSGPWTTIQAARATPGYDIPPTSTFPISKIRWTYTGPMAVAAFFTNTIDVCVRTINFKTGAAVLPTQSIIDTAVVQSVGTPTYLTTNTLTVTTTSPHLIAEKAFVGSCDGTGAHPGGPWFPGDIVRFRIAVANLGSTAATPCTITDLLPAGFSYQGNETYYYGPITPPGNWLTAYTPACNTMTSTVPSQILGSGSLTKPVIGTTAPTNCVWTFPTLPSRCDGTPDYFIIEFDVKIIATPVPTLPGTYPNNFAIAAANAPSVTSNNAYVVVSSRPSLTAVKEVRQTPGGTFGPNATIPPGGTGEYRLTITNTGNVPLSNLCLLDILPHVGDIGVLPPYAPRNSQFNVVLTTPIPAIVGYTENYYNNSPNPSATGNPSRFNVCSAFCIGADAPSATTGGTWATTVPGGGTYSLNISANSSVTLAPGGMLQVIVPFTVPSTAVPGDTACNSFAYQCSPLGSTTCLAAEPVDVCIKVGKKGNPDSSGCCPCDTLSMAPTNIYNNIQTQWKTITIYNLHCTPIDSINLRYYDCSTGLLIPQINLAALNGGNLHVYRNPSTNVTEPYSMFNASNRYQHMPLPVNTLLPKYGSPLTQDRVSFDLGLNYFLVPPSWCIKVIIYHQNDSCVDSLPRWTPQPPSGGTGIGNGNFNGAVYGIPITIDPKRFKPGQLGYASGSVTDSLDIILGGSGGVWESQVDSIAPAPQPLSLVQSKRTALFRLAQDSANRNSVLPLYVFILHGGDTAKKPRITIGLFDNESNLLSTDTVQASKIIARVGPQPGVIDPSGNLQITGITPNPARNSIEVLYHLGASDETRLEMFNTLGVQVGVLADGYQAEGDHSAHFIVGSLPEGNYYLRLSTRSGQTTSSLRIIH